MASFRDWPKPEISTTALAEAGFYHNIYLDRPDATQCAFCSLSIANWDIYDDPMQTHVTFAKTNCEIVRLYLSATFAAAAHVGYQVPFESTIKRICQSAFERVLPTDYTL